MLHILERINATHIQQIEKDAQGVLNISYDEVVDIEITNPTKIIHHFGLKISWI